MPDQIRNPERLVTTALLKEVVIQDTRHGIRVIEDTDGKFWGQIFCKHHQEWETADQPFASKERGVATFYEVIEELLRSPVTVH